MGYYTKFTLKWALNNTDGEKSCQHKEATGNKFCLVCGVAVGIVDVSKLIGDFITRDTEAFYPLDASGESKETAKWYEHEERLKELSNKFPTVLFTLHGEGEESGDIWRKYFLGGKMQKVVAVMTFEDFDKSKLK